MPSRRKPDRRKPDPFLCTPVFLPREMQVEAMHTAIAHDPRNAPPVATMRAMIARAMTGLVGPDSLPDLTPGQLAAATTKYWGSKGVKLTVKPMESISQALLSRILKFANKWRTEGHANVEFVYSLTDPVIRFTREGNQLYSYMGTDNLHIPRNQHTMMLGGYSDRTPDSELDRSCVHEFGHALGLIHEHLRRALVQRLDPAKTTAYMARVYGWDSGTTRSQVLTPAEESSLMGSPVADEVSVMCYQLSGECTTDGRPIVGGSKLSEIDKAWIAKLYPMQDGGNPTDPAPYFIASKPGRYVWVAEA